MADTIYPGNATPAQVLSGQKFSAGTNYNKPGTMPNNGQVILTPQMGQNTPITAGYHDGTGYVVPSTPAASGTATSSSTGTNLNGTQWYTLTVSGLSFQPKRIVIVQKNNTTSYPSMGIYDADDTMVNTYHYTVCYRYGSVTDTGTSAEATVTSTGFTVPMQQVGAGGGGLVYNWYAYE